MDRIRELLARITELSDDELTELKDLVLQEFDSSDADDNSDDSESDGAPPVAPTGDDNSEAAMAVLEELADAATAVQVEFARRNEIKEKTKASADKLAAFREEFGKKDKDKDDEMAAKPGGGGESSSDSSNKKKSEHSVEDGEEFADDTKKRQQPADGSGGGGANNPPEGPAETPPDTGADGSTSDGHGGGELVPGESNGDEDENRQKAATASGDVPEGRGPQKREVARTTIVAAGSDLPNWPMGQEIGSMSDLAAAMTPRIHNMRGIRGGDGEKLIMASASLDIPDDKYLRMNNAEENLRKVQAFTAPSAILAAGGLAAPEESKYDLFGMGVTDRPVRSALPVFKADRGGVRFIRPPTLNDLNGAVGVWTVEDDIEAATNVNVRKPAFRVNHGPEIVVDTQAITMILTFGNLVSRAYPELVARHNELALIAQARVAEQQLLTQIGALSTHVTGRQQQLSAVREVLMQIDMCAASYRNRHRTGDIPLQCIMPMWFMDMLRADMAAQHPGDGLEIFDIASSKIESWFSARNINVTWAMDGEAGQDYHSFAVDDTGLPIVGPNGADLKSFPKKVIWYLYVEGTFAFMDAGVLDLGLVRDSTLNSANDYQMFVESFENVVKFGHEALRVETNVIPTGAGSADVPITVPTQ